MAEATAAKLGFESIQGRPTEAPMSGRRVVRRIDSAETNPLTHVERTKINGHETCEQVFLPEVLAPQSWISYAAIDRKPVIPITPVTGLLLDDGKDGRLIWVPLEKTGFSAEELLALAKKRDKDSRVAVSFSFGNKPMAETPTPELVLRSASPVSDGKIDSLIAYFERSFDGNERVKLRTYLAGQQTADFEGSLQEYLMLGKH